MSQVDLRHIRALRQQRRSAPRVDPHYRPFHPYAKIAPDALARGIAFSCCTHTRR